MGSKKRMPLLFVGHGSPMNAVEDNEYVSAWEKIGREITRPDAILSISAHWYTEGSRVTDEKHPRTVYDMYGFPEKLYRISYQAEGCPDLARLTKEMIGGDVSIDNSWGYDHGTWVVLSRMYPDADIPVYQLSVDSSASAEAHFQIGRDLRPLRDKGVLIMGSGNVVHNLSRVDWDMDGGYPWAEEFDAYVKDRVLTRNFGNIVHWERAGRTSKLAIPMPDHYDPLLYVLGAALEDDQIRVFNDSCLMGSLSMTGYLLEQQ